MPLWPAAVSALITSICISVWALAANLGAKFGPFDDDETISWLNSEHRLPISSALSTFFNKHEIANFGDETRFTPAMYVAKIIEAVAFGTNVQMYYLSALVMFILSCGLLGFAVSWWFIAARISTRAKAVTFGSILTAVIATTAIASLSAWSDFATRLGASERIAVLGLGIMLVALTALATGQSAYWWIAALMGDTICVLGKENFVVISIAPLIIAVFRVRFLHKRKQELILGAVGLLPAALLVIALAPATLSGSDQYGAGTGGSRITGAVESLFVTYRYYWIPAALILILCLGMWVWSRGKSGLPVSLLVSLLITLGFIWRFYDAWLYGVHGYVYERYQLVPQLFKTFSILIAILLAAAAVQIAKRTAVKVIAMVSLFLAVCLGVVFASSIPPGLRNLRDQAELNRDATTSYSQAFDRVTSMSLSSGGAPIMIISQQPLDIIEMVRSISLELNLRDTKSPYFLIPELTPDKAETSLGQNLVKMSVTGNPAFGILPLDEIPERESPICVVIGGASTTLEECTPENTVGIPIRIR